MKVAIISDIHGNKEALIACCRKARSVGVKRYVCLGDIVGYGADPVAALDIVINLPGLIAVRGNHDEAVLRDQYPGVNKSIQHVLNWTRKKLLNRHREFLQALPYTQSHYGASFAHATMDKPESWEYLYSIERVRDCMQASPDPLVFTGHTHIPMMFYETPQGGIKQIWPEDARSVALYNKRRYFINVGSVGQPRDGENTACFTVYDTELMELTFFRVAYDFQTTAQKILEAGFTPHFAERLAGREPLP